MEFPKLALGLHLLHKTSPCLHFHVSSFPAWAPLMFAASQMQDMARPLCSPEIEVGGALTSRDSPVSHINRKKESQYEGNWLTAQVGPMWKGDNGLGIAHINIFKMPIASRQPFTSDICEKHDRVEEGWRHRPPPTQKTPQLDWKKQEERSRVFLSSHRLYPPDLQQAGCSDLKLLQLPVCWCE